MISLPRSLVIGAGDPSLFPVGINIDQRGLPRTVNGKVNIGAVEAQFTTRGLAATGISLNVSAGAVSVGSAVVVSADVASTSGGMPTGSVTFTLDGALLSADVIAVHLSNLEGDAAENEATQIRRLWADKMEAPARSAGVQSPTLALLRTPFREFCTPFLKNIDKVKNRFPKRLIAVIIPESVEQHSWNALLHSRRASQLRSAFRTLQDDRVIGKLDDRWGNLPAWIGHAEDPMICEMSTFQAFL